MLPCRGLPCRGARLAAKLYPQKRVIVSKLFSTRVLTAVVLGVAIGATALLLWRLANVLLLGFAGVLVAVFLRAGANAVRRMTRMSEGWALAVVLLLLLALLGLASWLLLPRIVGQLGQLINSLPTLLTRLEAQIKAVPILQTLTQQTPSFSTLVPRVMSIITSLSNTLVTAVSALFNVFLVFIIGLFLAATPKLYRHDLIRLVPVASRKRARKLVVKLSSTLRTWLVGELLAMLLVAVCTTLGLWLIGVPYALVLGIAAGLLDFIPYLGPVLSTVPSALIALTSGGVELMIWAVVVHIIVQQLEGNLFQPVIQQEAVSIPPVLLLLALVGFGQLFGLLGLIVATPLLAIGIVLVKELYVGWLEAPPRPKASGSLKES